MSGRGLRAAGVAGGVLVLLTGCTVGTHSHVSATSSALAGSLPPPVGSIEHPRPVECVDGVTYPTLSHPPATTPSAALPFSAPLPSGIGTPSGTRPTRRPAHPPTKGARDVTVGPLTWKGLRTLATGDQSTYGARDSDGWHYRFSPDLRPGAVVTVIIGAQQRARAGLEYGGGYGITPAPAVTFHSCPSSPTTFPGGFFIAGDGRACVPLDVRIGDGPPRHVVISFFNGTCPA